MTTTRTCGPIWSQVIFEVDPRLRGNNETWAVNCTYTLPPHSYEFSVVEVSMSKRLNIDWTFRNISYAQISSSKTNIYDPQFLKTNTYRGLVRLTASVGREGETKLLEAMPAVVVDILSTDLRSDHDPAGPPDVSVHRVLFYHCAQTFFDLESDSASMFLSSTENSTEPMEALKYNADQGMDMHQVLSNGEVLTLHETSRSSVLDFLRFFFSSLSANVPFQEDLISIHMQDVKQGASLTLDETLGPWVWHNGVDRAIRNVVTTVSSLIRNNDLGDNLNEQMFEGTAWETEAYFIVRWAWMAVIMLETLCVTVLLGMTIVISWKDGLVKDSNFALLVHGLEGWDTLSLSKPETTRSLDKMARGMTAKLEADDDGVLKFRRHGGQGGLDNEK